MTRPINENLKQRQETILMVAEEVFAQYSFAGATIRLITQKSGINSSMVGYYFGSKEALYEHIFKLRLEEITEEISRFEMLDLEAPEKLQIYLTTYIKRVDANQSFYRLLSNELTTPQHPSIILLASKGRKLVQDFLLKTIRDGTSRGYFKKMDHEMLVLSILALIWSVFANPMATHTHPNKPPQEDLSKRITNYIMDTLSLIDHNEFKIRSHV